jgi:alkylation response protein AidB-like acyl-CoA dehydrogenase
MSMADRPEGSDSLFRLTEQEEMVQQMVRQWCERTLLPKVPAMESGELEPWGLMREFARTFGLDHMAASGVKKRVARLRDAGPEGDAREDMFSGAGGSPLLGYVVVKELSRISPGFAMGWGVSVGLAGGAIVAKGTPDQIERWGLPIVKMEKVASWCLTEPSAGSDAFGSMKTVARPHGDGYVLSGSKTFITNGPGADLFVVYARIDRGEPRAEQPVATFVLERGMPGFSQGKPFKKMGMRDSPTCELFFEDVPVPAANLLGGKEKGAGGRRDVKESLGNERSGVPAMAWGIIERCYDQTRKYVLEREQFGKPIAEFQAVQLKIADMYIKLRNVENLVFRLAWQQKHGIRDLALINASKAYAAQMCIDVALTAIQCHGGYGYMEEYHLEKLARDAKLLELGAGTTDINLLTAARHELGLTGRA